MRSVIHLYGKHRLSNPLPPPPSSGGLIFAFHTCDVISQRYYASRNTRVICYVGRPVARGFVSPLGCMFHVTKLLWRQVACSTSVGRQNRTNPAQLGVISVPLRLILTAFPYVWVPTPPTHYSRFVSLFNDRFSTTQAINHLMWGMKKKIVCSKKLSWPILRYG